jgi:hypothetical protein
LGKHKSAESDNGCTETEQPSAPAAFLKDFSTPIGRGSRHGREMKVPQVQVSPAAPQHFDFGGTEYHFG